MANDGADMRDASRADAAARARVLVVEDDAAISDVTCSVLAQEGYACTPAYSGSEARLLVEGGAQFDLVICDLMLPGMPGEDVVALVRSRSNAPILVTSAKAAVVDRVALLRAGADDYLVKPFDLDEFVARVEALIRRAGVPTRGAAASPDAASAGAGAAGGAAGGGAASGSGKPHGAAAVGSTPRGAASAGLAAGSSERVFGAWRLNEVERTFEVADVPVRLTRTEFDIVAALMRRPRKVFTKRELYQAVWREEAAIEEKSISTHVSNIRAKLKATGTGHYIETVWGIGFKLADEAGV